MGFWDREIWFWSQNYKVQNGGFNTATISGHICGFPVNLHATGYTRIFGPLITILRSASRNQNWAFQYVTNLFAASLHNGMLHDLQWNFVCRWWFFVLQWTHLLLLLWTPGIFFAVLSSTFTLAWNDSLWVL